ncbi:MAG: D-glycerate dehydrogenase [Gammaproteobacteria bacterium]|nr:D-glycerate dehydrogenase [Rhodocyclaceae bacterium]MBU3907680.1 D-glycerate dehydrogenase [Gammaproteobacteria bacterium]MBU3989225.1 D-glycerate dehydrogenase [Gammaproteobacteria bacterium]MBU4004326.1 D-glycerate dehydrogenase [Gammaproteobacteria bacterium]MBU4019735.1 D-glycerate dehydrogenase [Gammaproteobacteria bacterium]
MKDKILVSRAVFPEVIERLGAHFEVDYHDADAALPPSQLAARLADKQGALTLISDRIDAAVLAGAPGLKAVCNVAVGYNNLDLAALSRAGVMATNTPGVLDDTTADIAWALILSSARRVVAADKWVRAGQWAGWKFHDDWLGNDVHHATLGILGMGRIGQAVARRASGFEMQVIYHNRSRLSEADERACNAKWVEKDALLKQADFLVLMLPYSPATHHAIAAPELALMKPTAHLINVARGGIVDDAALIEALQQKRIAGAGLDVFENEPALDKRFFALDNVVLTPHIGSSSRATRMRMAMLAADNLIAALTGQRPPNLLNPEVLGA